MTMRKRKKTKVVNREKIKVLQSPETHRLRLTIKWLTVSYVEKKARSKCFKANRLVIERQNLKEISTIIIQHKAVNGWP